MPGSMVKRKIVYDAKTLEAALDEVNNSLLRIRKAPEKYGIPKSTLGDWITGMLIKDKRLRAKTHVVRINACVYGTVLDAWNHVGTATDKTAIIVR